MADLPSVSIRISQELTRYRSAVSEFLAQSLGKSINFLLDQNTSIVAGLAANNFSDIIIVNQSSGGLTFSHSPPAGYSFFGVVTFRKSAGAVQGTVNGVQYGSNTVSGSSTVSVGVSGGATVGPTGTGGDDWTTAVLVGIDFKSSPIII